MSRRLLTGNGAAAWGARSGRRGLRAGLPHHAPDRDHRDARPAGSRRRARRAHGDPGIRALDADGRGRRGGHRGARLHATSSQGLLYAMEMIYTVAGWRAPFVLVNVSRGLAAPITLEPDHNDVLAARDSGFLQLHCATCQEVLDDVLIAYRLAEDAARAASRDREPRRLLPLLHPRARRGCRTAEAVARFLPPFDAAEASVPPASPSARPWPCSAAAPTPTSATRSAPGGACRRLGSYDEVAADFAANFGRQLHGVSRPIAREDAEIVFFMMGSFATKARRRRWTRLRAAGHAVGLVRPRLLRPYPAQALRAARWRASAVSRSSIRISRWARAACSTPSSPSALYGQPDAPPILAELSFIGGLGGRDIRHGGVPRDGRRHAPRRQTAGRVPRARASSTPRARAARGAQAPGHRDGRAAREPVRRRRRDRCRDPHRRMQDLPSDASAGRRHGHVRGLRRPAGAARDLRRAGRGRRSS